MNILDLHQFGRSRRSGQRVCMKMAGGKEDGVNADFAGQSSANFLSWAA
jgi:hypothetical protein